MKFKVFTIIGFVALFSISPVTMASETLSWKNAGKVVKKVAKRYVAPATIVISGAADAAQEYSQGGDTLDVVGAGLLGAGSSLADTVVETAEDVGTIGYFALETAGDVGSTAFNVAKKVYRNISN